MSGRLDVERRLEDAVLELLDAWTPLTSIDDYRGTVKRRDLSVDAEYPRAYVQAYNMSEHGAHTGWYLGGLRLGALTYEDVDKSGGVVEQILGALRMWAQQENLVALINETVSAQTFGSELTLVYVVHDTAYEDATEASLHARVLELTVVLRPSRGETGHGEYP
jgi:hypothetical protein